MGKFKLGQPRHNINKRQDKQIDDIAKEVIEKHHTLLERLAKLESKEDIKPCVCPSPSILEPKIVTETTYIKDERPLIDTKARKYAKALRTELYKERGHNFLAQNKIRERLDKLESRKPEEKQIITQDHHYNNKVETIKVVEKTPKLVMAAISVSLILNILVLIIK